MEASVQGVDGLDDFASIIYLGIVLSWLLATLGANGSKHGA